MGFAGTPQVCVDGGLHAPSAPGNPRWDQHHVMKGQLAELRRSFLRRARGSERRGPRKTTADERVHRDHSAASLLSPRRLGGWRPTPRARRSKGNGVVVSLQVLASPHAPHSLQRPTNPGMVWYCRYILRRGACRHIFGSTATRPRHCHCISCIGMGAALRGKCTQQTAGGHSTAFGRRRPRSAAASNSPCAHAYTQALFGTVQTATSVKHFWYKFRICHVSPSPGF